MIAQSNLETAALHGDFPCNYRCNARSFPEIRRTWARAKVAVMPCGIDNPMERNQTMKRIIVAVLVAAGSLVSAASFAATDSAQGSTLNDSFHYPAY